MANFNVDEQAKVQDLAGYNPMILEADNYNYQAGDQSWLDSANDAITLGGRAAITSAVNSFINTGVTVANWFGADATENDTYADLLESNPDAAAYYKQHQGAVELAGFLGGSLIPGMAGVKAFQLAKAGVAGSRIARAAGLFSRPQSAIIDATLESIANGTPSIDATLKLNKYKALAYGFGDQALQAAAWETAVAATMGASPVLSNADWKDIALNITIGAGVGGAVGGLFDGFGIVGQFNRARVAADLRLRPNEALTNLGKGDYGAGDRIVAILDSIDKLPPPTDSASTVKQITTRKNAELDSRKLVNSIADDPEVGNAMFDTILKLKADGATNDELYMYLAQAKKFKRITEDDASTSAVPFYVNKSATTIKEALTSLPADENSLAFSLRPGQNSLSIGRFADGKSEVETGTQQFATAKEAFENGVDIWIDAKNLTHINPNSAAIKQVPRPGETNLKGTEGAPLILNLRNGRITDTAYAQIGDLVPSGEIRLTGDSKQLIFGDSRFNYSLGNGGEYADAKDYLRANGRFVWASERGLKAGDVINQNDLPMLDTALQTVGSIDPSLPKSQKLLESIRIKLADGSTKSLADLLPDLPNFVQEAKRDVALRLLGGTGETAENGLQTGMDAREVAARTNTDIRWLESGLPKTNTIVDFSPDPALVKTPSSVKIIYDVGDPVKDVDGMVARGMIGVNARIARGKDIADSTVANYLGKALDQLPVIDPEFAQMQANSSGAGASFLGFANANYGTVAEMFESVGAFVHKYKTELFNKVKDLVTPSYKALTEDPQAAAELGILQNVMRGSAEKYVFAPDGKTLILKDLQKYFVEANETYGTGSYLDDAGKAALPDGYVYKIAGQRGGAEPVEKGQFAAYQVSDKVAEWLKVNKAANDVRISAMNSWYKAQGLNRQLDPDAVYFPPVDTRKYNFVAFVREPAGNGASSSSVSALTASSESDLNTLISQVRAKAPDLDVITKGDIKRFHEARGDYDYNLNLVDNSVDDTLKRKGILSNYFPETRGDKVLNEWVDWHEKQETRLLRNMMELKYAQQFAELRDLGRQYTDIATSRTGGVGAFFSRTAENPYDDYIKTALDVSKKGEYRLWADANEKVEAWFDTAFNTARRAFADANKGLIPFEKANALTNKYGLGSPFTTAGEYMQAQNLLAPAPYLRTFIAKANSILAATTLRLDFLQSLVNTISTPVLLGAEVSSIKNNLKDAAKVGALKNLLEMELPGGAPGQTVLSTPKLIYNAINNLYGLNGKVLTEGYQRAGFDISLLRQQQSMLGELSFTGTETESALNAKFKAAVQLGEKLTGNSFAEHFTRFVSADAMRQITDAAGITGAEQLAYIRTFVNRVQGNYIASQRPIAFQGVLGQAMGLFQTYQFNMMQQLFRHIENGDTKTVATLLGLQSTLFGFQGLPLFGAINTHIIGNAPGNPTHTDAYSAIPQLVGKSLGDLLLYGGASWASGTALYSRGDINPRTITVLPINPADWPAVDGFTRFATNIYNTGAKLANGGNFVSTMLEGLEHNSISRPLAGLAQVAQGYATTTPGDLIARTNEVGAVANAARLAGSKPLNEAIALDAAYRSEAYKAKDLARIEALGSAVKTTLIAGGTPSQEQINEFATRYAASGGKIENFNSFFVNAMKNSNASKVNKVFQQLNSGVARNMMIEMGGQPLPDFTNVPATAK